MQNENHLWETYSKNKDTNSLNALLIHYYPCVEKIAYKLSSKFGNHFNVDDLTSYGVNGLYHAIEKFDITKNVKFEIFASIRIRGSMIDEIRKQDFVPRNVRNRWSKIEKAKTKLELKECRKVEIEELLDDLEIDREDFIKNKDKYIPQNIISLDEERKTEESNDDASIMQSMEASSFTNDPARGFYRKDFFNKIFIGTLNRVEIIIIYMYYYENMSMQEIGDLFNFSPSRISQIHKNSINKIKEKLNAGDIEYLKEISYLISNKS
jgi:RNA polymerase sigma factor for flagellar operon FliA